MFKLDTLIRDTLYHKGYFEQGFEAKFDNWFLGVSRALKHIFSKCLEYEAMFACLSQSEFIYWTFFRDFYMNLLIGNSCIEQSRVQSKPNRIIPRFSGLIGSIDERRTESTDSDHNRQSSNEIECSNYNRTNRILPRIFAFDWINCVWQCFGRSFR